MTARRPWRPFWDATSIWVRNLISKVEACLDHRLGLNGYAPATWCRLVKLSAPEFSEEIFKKFSLKFQWNSDRFAFISDDSNVSGRVINHRAANCSALWRLIRLAELSVGGQIIAFADPNNVIHHCSWRTWPTWFICHSEIIIYLIGWPKFAQFGRRFAWLQSAVLRFVFVFFKAHSLHWV